LSGQKIGHAGALDPFATGVLILLIGRATRTCEQIMGWKKGYDATIKLGATTPTDDVDSPEEPAACEPPSPERVTEVLKRFVGRIEQAPPAYSAIKLSGKRACDHVRQGTPVNLKPRPVDVYSIVLRDYQWPVLRLEVECGRGTYIRALARDLGRVLGTGGYLLALRRTRIGSFGTDQAVGLEQLTSRNVLDHVTPIG
jgi:tRNA pseudouridine55 synthase